MVNRVELTFSSGKFVAYPNVIPSSISVKDNVLMFNVVNEAVKDELVKVNINKLDLYEIFELNEPETTK